MAEKTKTKTNYNIQEEKFKIDQLLTQELLQLSDSDISDITRKLPDKKYYEFSYHMLFNNKFDNLEKEWQAWKPWDIWTYPVFDLNRFNIIMCQNAKYIHNKKILDIGCNIGYLSLFSLYLECKHVTGIDVREEKLNIADFICNKANFSNHTFKKVNIHNCDSLNKVMNGVETIIFSGVLYHVSNHYEILRNLSNSDADTMIIENEESPEGRDKHTPYIFWHDRDNTKNMMHGYSKDHEHILVGKPNQAWINMAMKELGWKLQKTEYLVMNLEKKTNHRSLVPTDHRCCSVFVR